MDFALRPQELVKLGIGRQSEIPTFSDQYKRLEPTAERHSESSKTLQNSGK
jgi:hypothetical protein